MNTTPATCKGSFKTELSKHHIKNMTWCGAQPRCSTAIPCFVVAATVMKKPTIMNKLSEIMGLFHKEMIVSFLKRRLLKCTVLCYPVFVKSSFHKRDESLPLHNASRFRAHFRIRRILIFFSVALDHSIGVFISRRVLGELKEVQRYGSVLKPRDADPEILQHCTFSQDIQNAMNYVSNLEMLLKI